MIQSLQHDGGFIVGGRRRVYGAIPAFVAGLSDSASSFVWLLAFVSASSAKILYMVSYYLRSLYLDFILY